MPNAGLTRIAAGGYHNLALGPGGAVVAWGRNDWGQAASPPLNQSMALPSIRQDGGGQPHDNMQPYLALTFIIALQGIFPPRG